MKKLKSLDLFSGIGGFKVAQEMVGGFETTQFVENDPYCQKVLKKHWPHIPIHDDISTFTAKPGEYSIITGGFPCQSISTAGKGEGITETSKSGLWFELIRVIRMVRPKYFILENVAAILNNGMDIVLRDIYETGFYECEWATFPAAALGAAHWRDRWFLIGISTDPNSNGHEGRCFETRNKVTPGQDSQIIRPTNTSELERCSDDGKNKRESRTDEDLSRSSDGRKTISTETGKICNLSQESNDNKRIRSQDNYQEDNDRALVSEGQSRVQLSKHRELGEDKTTFEDNTIRQGDDNTENKRMDNQESNVTDSNHNGSSTSEKSRSIEKTDGGCEKGKDKAFDIKRSGQPENTGAIQFNATDTESSKGNEYETKRGNGKSRTQEIFGDRNSSKNPHLWRFTKHRLNPNWRGYVSECVIRGGVNGLRDRPHRLRMLGNSVVPQCAAIPLQRVKDIHEQLTSVDR